ncbi:hypothetical protein [Alteraurantiacibacter buctensis]|uniref:Uncharacterized protein n=1 Tax=Alteraurantiacibacter buctensis TaxID=1503981 RepID=A0A844YWF7_9SPHN|nr:hypothetical protein [Alteraurantiacibacter buctensis]MXO71386.1 hypothetical protein [Alteraurantiacibacter buctensis]
MTLSRRDLIAGAVAAAAVTSLPAPALAQRRGRNEGPVEIERPELMAGMTQVTPFAFTVAFMTESRASARAGGGLLGGGFGGRSTVRSELVGVGDADFQAATDAAWAVFQARLAASGVTLADRAGLIASLPSRYRPLEQGVERDVVESRNESSKARLFAPTALGTPVIMQEWMGWVSGAGFNGTMHSVNANQGAAAWARSTGIPVVSTLLVVSFAEAETYGGAFRNTSSVSTDAALALLPERSLLSVYANGRVGEVSLREAVASAGDFGTYENTNTTADRIGQGVANVIGLLGGVGTNSSRKMAMTADPARWKDGVNDIMTQGLDRLVGGMTGR